MGLNISLTKEENTLIKKLAKEEETEEETIQQTNSLHDKFLHNKQKVGEGKMNKKDGLYWGDRERIIRAEEIREKNEKIRLLR